MEEQIHDVLAIWDTEHQTTLEVFAAVPEGYNDRTAVADKGWTLGGLIWHICITERWLCADIMGATTTGKNPVPMDGPPPTVAAMAAAFRQSHAALSTAIRRQQPDWLAQTVDFYGERWTRLALMHLMFRHEAHHRGQLSILMMLVGGQPPTIYGAPGIDLQDAG
ncbi:DinB family protein [Xanthomonas maliensis]|uniref:DinB family protein n=1 Tax=Xanthomonas maliensis TaxID=1321368 RepID=UPI0003AB0928|nr:DinB family protein [Xanthomonas maliensis]KAB7766675.1 hypothetical protein CKY51_12845 [Xanthomonas maliensis]